MGDRNKGEDNRGGGMNARVVFCPSVPTEIHEAVSGHIIRALPLLPAWVNTCHVYYEAESDHYACVIVQTQSRNVTVTISGNYLKIDNEKRELVIIHEFAHCYTAPTADAARESIKAIVGSDYPTPGSKIAELYVDEMMEQATEDLAILFQKLIPVIE